MRPRLVVLALLLGLATMLRRVSRQWVGVAVAVAAAVAFVIAYAFATLLRM